ncbi:PhoH family protein [Bifidobacterium bombi DSM 19703]|uniref:PhoH-like protein n=1 Tax=Bifidobacterium bombi DSM 19703 TaxID=1341695 RepID=A0A080N5Z6_9BIFI|nr:PhoH family protein [Bifidobacterium bombi]KFF31139.1 PhoH family protein [Bifidobacterium bombi DSM 19703]
MAVAKRVITIPEDLDPVAALGPGDAVLAEVERAFPKVDILVRGNRIELSAYSARDDAQAGQALEVLNDIIDAAYKAPVEAAVVRRTLERNSVGRQHGHRLQAAGRPTLRAESDWSHEAGMRRAIFPAVSGSAGDAKHDDEADHVHDGDRLSAVDASDRVSDASQSNGLAVVASPVRHGRHAAPAMHGEDLTSDFGYVAKVVQQVPPVHTIQTGGRRSRIPGIITLAAGEPVRAKTAGQVRYVGAIEDHTITFGIGPAGTGKTYLAVAKAVRAFEDGRVSRIILTRPAVEAGENLGFLPGTLNDKVDPYLRPLYDALSDMLGSVQLHRYMNDGSIEVAPLAYMRGRTLNDAFVILDEAQNTTEQQMKMFLTRLGFNTKMVITGDVTQVDLAVRHSGLGTIERILEGIGDIAFIHLSERDVVRHALVGRIVAAYNAHDERLVQAKRDANDLSAEHGCEQKKTTKNRKSEKKKHKKNKGKNAGSLHHDPAIDVSGSVGGPAVSRGLVSNSRSRSPDESDSGATLLSEVYGAGSFNDSDAASRSSYVDADVSVPGADGAGLSGASDIEGVAR